MSNFSDLFYNENMQNVKNRFFDFREVIVKDKRYSLFSVKYNRTEKIVEDKTDPFLVLCKDVIIEILKQLDKADLKNASLVSKKWFFYSNSNYVWKRVYMRADPRGYTPEYFDSIIRQRKNIRNELIMLGIQHRINNLRTSLLRLENSDDPAYDGERNHYNGDIPQRGVVPIFHIDFRLPAAAIINLVQNILDAVKIKIKQSEINKLEEEYDRYSMK